MSKQLGVEMTVLRAEDRNALMKGMILRRLVAGNPLTKDQLDVGIGQDIIEIKKRFSAFEFETYVGCDLDSFYTGMTAAQLINQRTGNGGSALFERGRLADEFSEALSDDMDWMVDLLPMSTRGFFDDLKVQPEREVIMDVQDVLNDHATGKKRMVVDHSKHKHNLKDHQLRGGPIIRP